MRLKRNWVRKKEQSSSAHVVCQKSPETYVKCRPQAPLPELDEGGPWDLYFFNILFFKVIFMPNVGLKFTTPRSKAARSTE